MIAIDAKRKLCGCPVDCACGCRIINVDGVGIVLVVNSSSNTTGERFHAQLSEAEVAAIWAATEKESPDDEPERLLTPSGKLPKRICSHRLPGGDKRQRAKRPRAVG